MPRISLSKFHSVMYESFYFRQKEDIGGKDLAD